MLVSPGLRRSVSEERLAAAHIRIARLNRAMIIRVLLKLALLSLFATLGGPDAAAKILVSLLFMSAFLSAILGLHFRARLTSSILGYWDETAFLLTCAFALRSLAIRSIM